MYKNILSFSRTVGLYFVVFTLLSLLVKLPSMKVLAIETATMAGSIAVIDDDTLIGEVRINVKIAHSERVMTSVEWLLTASNLSINDIDAFAVSIGPGSFTGLRIGLSTIKGLSYAAKKPIVPVPTLDAFAWKFRFSSHPVCPMLDARKNEVYAALYNWENVECRKLIPETATAPAELLNNIKGRTIFTGEGARIYRKLIIEKLGGNALFASSSDMSPSASSVAEIAIEKLKEGITADPASLTPFYLRRAEAEILWKG
ncbi:MAG: tRNA (adenosine(37)-N6)-threonylcarbamoyltransferase complex dimerization subunit type 1 TsaB [Nitrospirota bacterium]